MSLDKIRDEENNLKMLKINTNAYASSVRLLSGSEKESFP